jgi:outer membrane protein assembly factor BamB
MKKLFALAACLLAGASSARAAVAPGYYTFHFDNARTGWNPDETQLTPRSVGSSRFAKLATLQTDSIVFAQPLYVPGVRIGGVARDVVLVVTENDSVYAFDAATDALLWRHSVLGPGVVPESRFSVDCYQIAPTIGISSTPVVDPATQTLYFTDKVTVVANGALTDHAQLRALDIATGTEKSPPADITATLAQGRGGPPLRFLPRWQQQRPALLLVNGVLYVAFGSSCDLAGAFVHGWIFAYDAATLRQLAVFNTTGDHVAGPNPVYFGAIWQGTFGPAADEFGDVYVATGNGAFDANLPGGRNFGDSIVKLNARLGVLDYFTPFDQQTISDADLDVGSAGVMVIPSAFTGTHRLAIAGGKNGMLFLLDRDDLGKYAPGGPDRSLQDVPILAHTLFGGPAFYEQYIYYNTNIEPLTAYRLSLTPAPHLAVASQAATHYGNGIPVVSSNGALPGTAVLWVTNRVKATGDTFQLTAFDATDLTKVLFHGDVGPWNGLSGLFFAPTVFNGRVYVPGDGNGVAVFGLRT